MFPHKFIILIATCLTIQIQAQLNPNNLEIFNNTFDFKLPLFSRFLKGAISNPPLYVYSEVDGVEIPLGVFKKEHNNEHLTLIKLNFLNQMKESGFIHLPKLIKNAFGNYLTYIDGENFSCFEYLPPDLINEKIPFSFVLELIAKFHHAAKYIENAEPLKIDLFDLYIQRQPYLFDEILKELEPTLFDTPTWRKIQEISPYFLTQEFINLHENLPQQLIHGDAHYKNIVVSKNIPYLIDFDIMTYGPRVRDISSCICFGFYDEYLEKTQNKTLISFIESNFSKGGTSLEPLEKESIHKMVLYRQFEVMTWQTNMLKDAYLSNDLEKYNLFKRCLKEQMSDLEKLFAIQTEENLIPK